MQVILGHSSEWSSSSFEVNSGLFLSARPGCTCLFTPRRCGRFSRMFRVWKTHDRIRYRYLRRENWSWCGFHMYYLNREYLFWTWLHLKVDISGFLYTYMSVRQVFAEVHVVLFMCLWREVSQRWQRTHRLCSLFYKSTLFCCYDDFTQIKVDALQFQTTLFLSVRLNREYF